MSESLQKFVHSITALLSWHVQIFIMTIFFKYQIQGFFCVLNSISGLPNTLVNVLQCHMVSNISVNFSSGHGLSPDGHYQNQCWFSSDHKEHISLKFYLKFKSFHSRKCSLECHLPNDGHFVQATMYLTHLPLVPHICVYEFRYASALVQIMACRLVGSKP